MYMLLICYYRVIVSNKTTTLYFNIYETNK